MVLNVLYKALCVPKWKSSSTVGFYLAAAAALVYVQCDFCLIIGETGSISTFEFQMCTF